MYTFKQCGCTAKLFCRDHHLLRVKRREIVRALAGAAPETSFKSLESLPLLISSRSAAAQEYDIWWGKRSYTTDGGTTHVWRRSHKTKTLRDKRK